MRCGACNAEVPLAPGERIGFRDGCPGCGADLHSCRSCAHRDPSAYNECREPGAEWVSDRERANRCDLFSPGAGGERDERVQAGARDKLENLFKK